MQPIVGSTVEELTASLDYAESQIKTGEWCRVVLCSAQLPSQADLVQMAIDILNTGHHIKNLTARMVDGVPTTSFDLQKSEPYSRYQWQLLIPLIVPIAIVGLITFGIFKIKDITNSVVTILLVAGGIVILTAALLRKPAEKVAVAYIESGKGMKLLPDTKGIPVKAASNGRDPYSGHNYRKGDDVVWVSQAMFEKTLPPFLDKVYVLPWAYEEMEEKYGARRRSSYTYAASTVPLAPETTKPFVQIIATGQTNFNIGDLVDQEVFKKENDRVRALGERPATGQIVGKGMVTQTSTPEAVPPADMSVHLKDLMDKLTANELDSIVSSLMFVPDLDWRERPSYDRGRSKTVNIEYIVSWAKRNPNAKGLAMLHNKMEAKVKEKAAYPVTGQVPGTKYIKWSEFIALPSYPAIAQAVAFPHDYRLKSSPQTKDGYVSVHAIYNMSAWANWKSSSLGESERLLANKIDELHLLDLMKLNHGRRMDQPALFPEKMLPASFQTVPDEPKYIEVKMGCVGCRREVPSPKSFRSDESLRRYMMTGLCQACQDAEDEAEKKLTEVWGKMTAFEGLNPEEKFIVFSENNPYKQEYDKLIDDLWSIQGRRKLDQKERLKRKVDRDLQDLLGSYMSAETVVEKEKGWKDFFHGNKVQANIEAVNWRLEHRKVSQEKQNDLHQSLKTPLADLVQYQDLQAWGFASGLLTQEEAEQLYDIYGRDIPDPDKWDKRTLAEKITATRMADELINRRMALGDSLTHTIQMQTSSPGSKEIWNRALRLLKEEGFRQNVTKEEQRYIFDSSVEFSDPVRRQMKQDLDTYPLFDAIAMWVQPVAGSLASYEPRIIFIARKLVQDYEYKASQKPGAKYNGWTNYETWNVNLWVTNDEGQYKSMVANRPFTPQKARQFVLGLYPNGTPDMKDMGGARAYDKVDWMEIVEAWNEGYNPSEIHIDHIEEGKAVEGYYILTLKPNQVVITRNDRAGEFMIDFGPLAIGESARPQQPVTLEQALSLFLNPIQIKRLKEHGRFVVPDDEPSAEALERFWGEQYASTYFPKTVELLSRSEGDPLSKFCCRIDGECAPKELLAEGKFPERMEWLRKHYEQKHPGLWGEASASTEKCIGPGCNLIADSPELLADTIAEAGWREKLDTAFQEAMTRVKGEAEK